MTTLTPRTGAAFYSSSDIDRSTLFLHVQRAGLPRRNELTF
jgi:hypothetical protein